MKLHLPLALSRALFVCFATLALAQISSGATSESYPKGSKTYTTRQTNLSDLYDYETILFEQIDLDYELGGAIYNDSVDLRLFRNGNVTFSGNTASSSSSSPCGGAIYNKGTFTLSDNGGVSFSGNTAYNGYSNAYGGAIYSDRDSTFTLSGNGDVSFSENTASNGGAIFNGEKAAFTLSNNGAVTFSGNTAAFDGSAIRNKGTFTLRWNGDVTFSENAANGYGGAICNDGSDITFTLSDNGAVTFSENTAYCYGGVIYNNGSNASFTLSNNGDVTFSGNSAASIYTDARGGAIFNGSSFTLSDNGDVTFSGNSVSTANGSTEGGAIYNKGTFMLRGNGDVSFSGNSAARGSAIYNKGTFTLSHNGAVSFSGNSGRVIYNDGSNATFTLRGNENVTFSGNSDVAIYNAYAGTFTLRGNENVTFSGNTASSLSYYVEGGAIYNKGTFTLSDNEAVTFSGNTASSSASSYYADGGAIFNINGTFTLSDNGAVTFSGNTASSARASYSAHGGAIFNGSSFTLSDNGDVLFEKNAEIRKGTYRLRSIYSTGTLNLSASEGKSILFKDSVYAEGTVNLNQGSKGDIIFTGVSIEADLREVKGGIDGTAAEILDSRTSEFATNAKLYGGRLIVEDGAILKGKGITITEGANATIRLNDATLDETGYAIAVSSGSGLEFEGENTLAASAVSLADNSFLSFVMGEGAGTAWDAQLTTGQLHVRVSGDLFNEHQLLTLSDDSQYDTGSWTSDSVTVSGTSFDSLSWDAGVLTYTPHVITPGEDGPLDDVLPDDGHAVIDGNGHTLTVKNEVQMVQMALKDGIVKLEGENNNIVSVSLTEGGELLLSAGAGLTTGDIISMVASGKGELVISGNITLDNKGLKGKDGKQATVSHADMQVLGDASVSNVRVENSVIDLAEGCTVNFSQVVLAATARLTDEPATAVMDEVTAELMMGVNTSKMADGVLPVGAVLVQNGNTAQTLSPEADATVVQLEATTFDSLTLTGSSLVLELRGLETELYNGADYIALSFTSGKSYATFEDDLVVLLSTDGEHYAQGHYLQGGDHTTLYFDSREAGMTPEPTSTTLSLLALAALAARRKRK